MVFSACKSETKKMIGEDLINSHKVVKIQRAVKHA